MDIQRTHFFFQVDRVLPLVLQHLDGVVAWRARTVDEDDSFFDNEDDLFAGVSLHDVRLAVRPVHVG
jgi:hypothetical protein